MVRGKREEEMERMRQRVCVSPVYVFGDPHSEAWACDLFQNTNVSLISTALKKNHSAGTVGTHTRTHSDTCTQMHICIYIHTLPTSTHIATLILLRPCNCPSSFMHTHPRTHPHTPGCLIYFNYNQIHRDPITKIEGYLFFSVHPKRLIKFSCKDEIIWYNTNVFSFS